MATQILVAAMQMLRTYALYARNKRIALLMVSVACVLIGLSAWAVTSQEAAVSLQQGCHIGSSKTSAIHIAVAWEALFVFDAMIFSLTLLKTYKERLKYSLTKRLDIVSLMVRDGAIYFGVMLIAQAASAISVTMMSRLALNLHSTAGADSCINATTLPLSGHIVSTLQFTTQISLAEGNETDEEDHENERW
ncbi:hypothetical protein BC835DRAFT_249847 [Cytidiella melzeri]|nr:hypothetical protein BC835DRAFT_249847 [Cytidiella melzeri]